MPEPMRIIIVIVDRGKGNEVAEFGQLNNIDYAFLTYGRGTLRGEMLNMLGLGTVDKDVVASIIPRREVKTHLAGLSGLLKLKRPGKGIAFSIPLGALNGLVANAIETTFQQDEDQEKEVMKPMAPKFSLIITVVEAGFVDQVMESAKSAGATGGTLLHARGIGREEGAQESIMGASLQTEKEVVTILAERTMHKEIMEAINKDCGILTRAKGVVFSLPVDEIVGIGN
ncbi:hypothetical protein LJC27_04635 [Christensenellaceae bacterium OttesenSCG-928-M15]|nr:hypothetical protein [Christensenellaceae bacterium OttesenSCG-928-M15]